MFGEHPLTSKTQIQDLKEAMVLRGTAKTATSIREKSLGKSKRSKIVITGRSGTSMDTTNRLSKMKGNKNLTIDTLNQKLPIPGPS